MATRVLAIFPEMDTGAVEEFRSRWDPLSKAVSAHITVAFPFEWPASVSVLAEALSSVVASCAPFGLELATPTIWEAEYLFLLVEQGREQVRHLHESVYDEVLSDARRLSQFVPHMTVGRQANQAALSAAVSEAAGLGLPFVAQARALTVYRRNDNGRRVKELDLPLGTIVPN